MATWNEWISDNVGYDDGWLSVGGVGIDTGLGGGEPEVEAEVVYLEPEPKPFPWEWIAGAGVILAIFYMGRRR